MFEILHTILDVQLISDNHIVINSNVWLSYRLFRRCDTPLHKERTNSSKAWKMGDICRYAHQWDLLAGEGMHNSIDISKKKNRFMCQRTPHRIAFPGGYDYRNESDIITTNGLVARAQLWKKTKTLSSKSLCKVKREVKWGMSATLRLKLFERENVSIVFVYLARL